MNLHQWPFVEHFSPFFPANQFFRVLWENLGLKFTEEEEGHLVEKYAPNGSGKIYYRAFVNNINQPFDANNLSVNPATQKPEIRFVSFEAQLKAKIP